MYQITIRHLTDRTGSDSFQVFDQTVEDLNLKAVIDAINTPPPPKPVPRKRRKDAGQPKAKKNTEAQAV